MCWVSFVQAVGEAGRESNHLNNCNNFSKSHFQSQTPPRRDPNQSSRGLDPNFEKMHPRTKFQFLPYFRPNPSNRHFLSVRLIVGLIRRAGND